MVVPPVVNEIRSLPAELHPFYMYLRQAMGPFAQGPVALIARHGDECVFSADALGLRPLWKVETPDDYIFSSEPGVVSVHDMVSEPLPLGPGEKFLVTIDRDKRRATLHEHAEMQRVVARRWSERTGGERGARQGSVIPAEREERVRCRLRPCARHRRSARGGRDPRLHLGRAGGAREGGGPRARRLRLAARRRQALPADGVERRRADRLARLRRPAGGALAGAPEPGRLLQGDGRRRHQPGDRPRARDRALLDPGRVRPPPLDRRSRHRHGHRRDLVPGHPRRPPRPRAALGRDLPRDRPRAPDLPARGPLGGVPRPGRRARHRAARVRDDPWRDRPAAPGGRQARRRRRRAPRAHRPHRLRRRAPLPRRAPRPFGGRPGAEAVQGRARRGEPAPALLDRAALGGDPQRPRRRPRPRPRRQRRLPLRDARGRLRRRLRRGRLQPLRRAPQGDREGDLDDRHPRGPRLRPPVLVDRDPPGAGRDLRHPGIRRLRARRGRLPGARLRLRRAPPHPQGRRGGASRRRRSASTRRSTRRRSPPPTAPPPTTTTPRRCASSRRRARSRCAT